MKNAPNTLALPASYAAVQPDEMLYIDGGALSLDPRTWFSSISTSFTISWNGNRLGDRMEALEQQRAEETGQENLFMRVMSWIIYQISLSYRINLS